MEKIGVLGAGVMGTGVAHLFAQNNYDVRVFDVSMSQLSKAKENIVNNVRYYKMTSFTNGMDLDGEEVASKISFNTDIEGISECDFVVENITENWVAKKDLYKKINEVCDKDCVISVNTSAIPVAKLASLLTNPERVVGVHFMNPVVLMPMVEVIKSSYTSAEALEKTKSLMKSVDKKFVIVNDSPGFVTNRAMMIFVNEAIYMVQENVAEPEEIDTLFRQCFGHKMGPLQTVDLIGLDTILYSLEVLYEEFNDDKYRPCWLLKKMVYAGLHGKKSGRGFYSY